MAQDLLTRSGVLASQQPRELQAFIALLRAENVTRYLEIGARQGDTFYAVMTSLPKGSVGVAVDLPDGPWGYGGTAEHLKECIEQLNAEGYKASYWLGRSDSPATERIVHLRGPYDAVLIDADHRYEGVSADYKRYRQRITALHDIAGDGQTFRGHEIGVGRFWKELEGNKVEIIDPSDERPMGIGVLISEANHA